LPPTFEGIDPERRLASRKRNLSDNKSASEPLEVNRF